MATWFNGDGLLVKLGTVEATPGIGGEEEVRGKQRVTEVKVTASTIAASSTIMEENVYIPKGARIEVVEVVGETACTAAGAATLDVGLIRSDRTTVISATGIVAALAKTAIDADGEYNKLVIGSTGVGASVGTTLAANGYITMRVNTGPYTAGVIRIRIYWYMPANL